jgi:very-short-patch-repair endonuclease
MKSLEFARHLRQEQTDCEQLLWSRLRAHRLFGLKFRRQQPVGRYVVDFFCAESRLIVELDGGQHVERADYDEERDAWLRGEEYVVLRYWNNDVMGNLAGVLEDIAQHAGKLDGEAPSPQPLPPQGGGTLKPSPLEGEGGPQGRERGE